MGSSLSKAGKRSLPKAASGATESSARRPIEAGQVRADRVVPPRDASVSASDYGIDARTRASRSPSGDKNEDILRDGKDPHLDANLRAIGIVNLDKLGTRFAPSPDIAQMMTSRQEQARLESERGSSGALPRNRMTAGALTDLLNSCKDSKSIRDLDSLAKEYNLDRATLDTLMRHINAPTIKLRDAQPVGSSQETVKATWT